ncbi:proline-rich protein 22 [Rhineura floridana]|uniref:proline-rich protein 22 n=1 Tax=Rhineura floridana TaxID=261503 RepID=UPI002AC85D86|nr:proline-rich protein 22 [Rhineura floridana]
MQQPKLFYPQHETYTPRPLDQPDGHPNQPFPAFVLPENLASVGTPSLYHPHNQEKDLPPAGFHMAPCGCFFDPRIYRIEWATANFVQPSVYKLSSGSGPPNTYLLDSQKYLKGPVQSVPYPDYQPATNSPQFVLPFFKPVGPTAHLVDPIGFVGNPAHGSSFMEASSLHSGLVLQTKEHKTLTMVPGLNLSEQPAPAGPYKPLKDCDDLPFQAYKVFPLEEGGFERNDQTLDFTEDPPVLKAPPEDHQTALSMPSAEIMTESEACVDLESLITNGKPLVEDDNEESFNLPDKVLLEDAMKLFDCSPVNSDTEASLDGFSNGGPSRHLGDNLRDSCFSGEDSTSDIRSLNLPDELLSFDYSVPEIVSAVTSLDYLYDVNVFEEESQWEGQPASQPLSKHDFHEDPGEKTKSSTTTAKKTKSAASKPKGVSMQGGDSEPQGLEPTALAS